VVLLSKNGERNVWAGTVKNKLNRFNLFRLCREDEISFDIVAQNGNNVKATFAIRRKNSSTCSIRQCCFNCLLRHYCWCERGITRVGVADKCLSSRVTHCRKRSVACRAVEWDVSARSLCVLYTLS